MRESWIAVMALAGLLLLPSDGKPQTGEGAATEAFPVSQPLVRQGDLALKLAEALRLGTAEDEKDAEAALASLGIAPENGWLSDYPVTPEAVGNLQETVTNAADSRGLDMQREEALERFQAVIAGLGLDIVVEAPGEYADNSVPTASYTEEDSSSVDTHYDENGPPVITYYPPPNKYIHLYGWVPCRFHYNGFLFTGFFCLNDFDRVVWVKHGRKFVSNRGIYHRSARPGVYHTGKWNFSRYSPARAREMQPQRRNPSHGRGDLRPSPLRGSFNRPALPERPLLMQPRSSGKKSFHRDGSLDRPHRGGSSQGGFFQESPGAGSGRGFSSRGGSPMGKLRPAR